VRFLPLALSACAHLTGMGVYGAILLHPGGQVGLSPSFRHHVAVDTLAVYGTFTSVSYGPLSARLPAMS
jgi:hypothetical protein